MNQGGAGGDVQGRTGEIQAASCNGCCQHEVRGGDLKDEQDGKGLGEDKDWDVVQTEPDDTQMIVAILHP